jgi:hypothetical protein
MQWDGFGWMGGGTKIRLEDVTGKRDGELGRWEGPANKWIVAGFCLPSSTLSYRRGEPMNETGRLTAHHWIRCLISEPPLGYYGKEGVGILVREPTVACWSTRMRSVELKARYPHACPCRCRTLYDAAHGRERESGSIRVATEDPGASSHLTGCHWGRSSNRMEKIAGLPFLTNLTAPTVDDGRICTSIVLYIPGGNYVPARARSSQTIFCCPSRSVFQAC